MFLLKRYALRAMNTTLIITHNGPFHIDDVFSVAILTVVFPNYKLTRSRYHKIIATGDIVLDVGGIFSHKDRRYDHHQDGFTEVFDDTSTILLSSIGLIWKYYGKQFLHHRFGIPDEHIEDLHPIIYKEIIQEIDAIDNGVTQYPDCEPVYNTFTFSGLIGRMNNKNSSDNELQHKSFMNAIKLVKTMMVDIRMTDAVRKHDEFLKCYAGVYNDIENRFNYDKTGTSVILTNRCGNFHDYLKKYEEDHPYKANENLIAFHIIKEKSMWTIRTIRLTSVHTDFKLRKMLPPQAVLDKKLSDPSKLIFMHRGRFIAKTRDEKTAIEIIKLANQ